MDQVDRSLAQRPPHGGVLVRGAPPPVPPFAIRRPRLEQLLDAHPERRVVLVRGPAGAGKTVLVAQWVRTQDEPCAWLSIEAAHDDLDHVLWHLVEALGRLTDDPSEAVTVGSSARGGIDDAVVWDLLGLVSDELDTRITLVIDDLDHLHDPAARRVLGRLVEHPHEAARVVLLSRAKPRLGLERARLRGDLVEIPPSALRFERAEIEELSGSWDGRRRDVAELEQATLGWAAGLRLLQLESAPDATSTPFAHDGVAEEYVREELVDGGAEGLQAFLELTCWLPVLTEPLRVALASAGGAQPPRAWSELQALPILTVASQPGTFRYPPILAGVVQQEYSRRDPQAASVARRCAADACRRAGEPLMAIELLLQAGCPEEAAAVCADLAEQDETSLRAIDDLLHRIRPIGSRSATWLPWRIRAAVAAGHVDEARRLLESAGGAAPSPDAPDGQADRDLLVARAVVAERLGDASALLRSADRLLRCGAGGADGDDGNDGDDGDGAVGSAGASSVTRAYGWRLRALAWSGDLDGARAALRALEQAAAVAGEATAEVAPARAWVAWLAGDTATIAESVIPPRGGRDDLGRHPELALLAGGAQRERNQLPKARSLLQRAQNAAVESSHRVVVALAAGELARCDLAAGAAMDALERVVAIRATHPDLPVAVDAHLRHTEVRVRLSHRDLDGARAVVRGAPPGPETDLLAARVARHEAPDRARALVDALDARTPRQTVERLLLRAQLPDVDEPDASAALVAAISAGGHLGLVRTFLDEGPAVSRRLQGLALESPDRTLGRLAALVSHELALAPTSGAAGPAEPLTPRELAVLRMLPLRLSNREMAAQMYISVNTIKTHVRAIYRKLEVPHRSAAIRRAKALQLV